MECKILAGKTFRFIGFAPEQVCQLVDLISKFGGTQMLSEQLVDFVVTPMNYEAEHVQAKNKVSYVFVNWMSYILSLASHSNFQQHLA